MDILTKIRSRYSVFIIVVAFSFMAFCPVLSWAAGQSNAPVGSYVIVVSAKTYEMAPWREVVDTLRSKYEASLVVYRNDVTESIKPLAEIMPNYTCFVEPADSSDRDFIVSVQRLTRQLDNDAFTDTQWAVLTGYEPQDALRIASASEPLTVDSVFSGTVSIGLDNVARGYQFNEGAAGVAKRKLADGSVVNMECPEDTTEAITQAWQDEIDAIYTSGHGMTTGWQIGYNFKGGFIKGEQGIVFGSDAQGKRIDFSSANTKVYLPTGNCLIGLIPQRDCFATAMMHSAGVNQMFGYIVVTFYGYMGWGINTYFGEMAGQYTLSESFYANQQAILYEIGQRFPELLNVEFTGYDYQEIHKIAAGAYPDAINDALGMLWDRDALAFYGDPAWQAKVMPAQLPWSGSIEKGKDDTWQLTIKTVKAGNWPNRPLLFFLPERLVDTVLIAGQEYKPVITDNFILVPLSGDFAAEETIDISFRGSSLAVKVTDKKSEPIYVGVDYADRINAIVAKVPQEYCQGVRDAFVESGANNSEILQVFERVSPANMEAAAFLIANMPKSDLRTLSSEYLLNNIVLAYQAASTAKWKNIPQDIFLNNVLPYANLDELRDDWRGKLMELIMPAVADCQTPIQAAQKINEQIWDLTGVKYSTEREKPNQNPTESMASGIASCSGLSILLVDACRSVGIPARVAGIAKWPHKDGNHSWVEVWDGKWYTLGAWDGKGPDDVWFASDAARAQKGSGAYGIFAVSYAKTDIPFRCVWSYGESEISAVEVTDRYLAMWQPQVDGNLTAFRVFSAEGKRVEAQIKIDSEGKEPQSGVSRGENRDTNDTASFKLMPGESYSIEVNYNGQIKAMSFTPENKAFQTVDIRIE